MGSAIAGIVVAASAGGAQATGTECVAVWTPTRTMIECEVYLEPDGGVCFHDSNGQTWHFQVTCGVVAVVNVE